MKYILVFAIAVTLTLLIASQPSMKDHFDLGYEAGKKESLNTARPSEDLELACAALWVGKQNKIWSDRNEKRVLGVNEQAR
jgi:hypothetical protein